MPRLQYNNPAIKFEVQKVKEAGVIPELTIEFGKDNKTKTNATYTTTHKYHLFIILSKKSMSRAALHARSMTLFISLL